MNRFDIMDGQIKESVLVRVFEMMVERLTAMEKKIDRFEEILEHEQSIRYGRLNCKAFLDFDANIFVHKPVLGVDQHSGPAMYCIYLDIEEDSDHHVKLYRTLQRELMRGEYEDELGSGVQDIKKLCRFRGLEDDDTWNGEESEGWLVCEQYSIESKRVFVHDHILDLKTSRWVSKYRHEWHSVRCVMDFGVTVWMEPSEAARNACNAVKSVKAALAVLKFLGFDGQPGTVEVGTLEKHIAGTVHDFDIAMIAYFNTSGEKEARLKAEMKDLRKHDWWKHFQGHVFWDNMIALGNMPCCQ